MVDKTKEPPRASLNPCDALPARTTRALTVSPYVEDAELGMIQTRQCPAFVKRGLRLLASSFGTSINKTCAAVVQVGVDYLYRFPGVDEIERAYQELIRCAPTDSHTLAALERGSFELGYSSTGRLWARCYVQDKEQCNRLAQVLGLEETVVQLLAIMAGLIHDQAVLPDEYVNQAAEVLVRFRDWTQERADWAKRVVKQCRVEGRRPQRRLGPNDVLSPGDD